MQWGKILKTIYIIQIEQNTFFSPFCNCSPCMTNPVLSCINCENKSRNRKTEVYCYYNIKCKTKIFGRKSCLSLENVNLQSKFYCQVFVSWFKGSSKRGINWYKISQRKAISLEILLHTDSLYSSSAAVNIHCIHLWLPDYHSC